MDGHGLLGEIAFFSTICADGGPRGYRRRGKELPEKYLPGHFLAKLDPKKRAAIVRAANSAAPLAPWFLRYVAEDCEPTVPTPPEPSDRRWCRRGRWSTS